MDAAFPSFRVDSRSCIRCAACATVAPAMFGVGPGPARARRAPSTPEQLRDCRAAVALCPTQAIVEEAGATPGRSPEVPPEPSGPLYAEVLRVAEAVRWTVGSVPWERFDLARATTELRAVVRVMAYSEQATFSATQRFMQAFSDDPDFSQWISVWFYEETRHPMVLLRWLALAGEMLDEGFVRRGRVSTPFIKSRPGTLVTNVISEMVAAEAYLRLARAAPEPLLAALASRIGADEGRHAASFYAYARRAVEQASDPDRERLDALKVLHFWLDEVQSVSHPVNQTMEALQQLHPNDAALPAFAPPRRRIARVVGWLIGLPLDSPEDVGPMLTEHTARVHAAAPRG